MSKKTNTFAIHIISESSDHYTFCEQGTTEEIVESVSKQMGDEIGWASSIYVQGLNDTDHSVLLQKLEQKAEEVRNQVDS